MNRFQIQRKIGILYVGFCIIFALLNLLNIFSLSHVAIEEIYLNVCFMGALALMGLPFIFFNKNFLRVALVLLYLLPAGPAMTTSNISFFGMWLDPA